MNELKLFKAGPEHIPVIQEISNEVWPLTYSTIISKEQIAYMLEQMYSTSALEQQFRHNHQFTVAAYNNIPVGFASFAPTSFPREYQLHKLYVQSPYQRLGIGRALLQNLLHEIKQNNGLHLILQVNRNNLKALEFYKQMGFSVEKETDVSIGSGFFMNDYIMGMHLT